MKIIIDSDKKRRVKKINNDIYHLILPEKHTILSSFYFNNFIKKLSSFGKLEFFRTDNLNFKIYTRLKRKISFLDIKESEVIFEYFENIIKKIITGSRVKILIIVSKDDERIFDLCKKINPYCELLWLSCRNENFYEKISDYLLDNFGIITVLKENKNTNDADINIILNSEETDFSEKIGYTINLSEKNIFAKKLLYDIVPNNYGDFSAIKIKKCQFLPSKCENFNLIWKNSQKSVDKSKK